MRTTEQLRNILESQRAQLLVRRQIEEAKSDDTPGLNSIIDLLPIVTAACIVMGAVSWLARGMVGPMLWIEKNGVTKTLPVFLAMRIVRKHGWKYVATEPRRRISRFQALKILIRGDRPEWKVHSFL